MTAPNLYICHLPFSSTLIPRLPLGPTPCVEVCGLLVSMKDTQNQSNKSLSSDTYHANIEILRNTNLALGVLNFVCTKFYCLRQGTSKRGEGRQRLKNCISRLCSSPLGSLPPPHPNRVNNT